MNLISLEKAAKAYGPQVLLDDVSLGIGERDRIGIVGSNGAGKSTLLALLGGLDEPDTGRVARTTGLRVGYLPQSDQLAGVVGRIAFGERHGGGAWEREPRARSVASELLFGISLESDVTRLSGGERRRVALAALLAVERDILLLDEPTNHLDIDAIDWLGRHLRDRGCAVVVVSHDRWLLDTVCDEMWEVADGQVYQTEGGYSAYVLAQAERQRTAEADQQRRRNLARKELAWLRRGPQARGTKPKFRVQEATALIAAEPAARDGAELTRLATARLGKTVLELEDVSVTVGDRTLLDDVTWRLGPGDRVGIVGVNGAGKTSLLRLLAGETADGVSVTGHVVRGKTVRVAHLSQELTELDSASPGGRSSRVGGSPPPTSPGPKTPPAKGQSAKRTREAVEEIRLRIQVGKRELSAGQLLERLGFYGDRQWTPVGDLSGGERRRLQMLRLLMTEPNVLLLDEPTNDLDIEMLTEFEDLLDGWPGTLVVVSHDRYFLERVTDRVDALLGDGKIAFLPRGVDEYLERVRARRAVASPERAGGARTVSAAAADRAARKELQRLERQIERAGDREATLNEQLAANATDYEKLTELGAQLRVLQAEKAGLEDRWLEVASSLES
jgi:ABC transport system ATP-binding/permease protein